ncbi:hypothetical protein D3C72_1351980 [compost metagenome]
MVALQQHVCAVQQAGKLCLASGGLQIEQGRALAPAQIGNGTNVGQARAVDHQHIGTMRGQRSRRHRAREDARQIQYPNP